MASMRFEPVPTRDVCLPLHRGRDLFLIYSYFFSCHSSWCSEIEFGIFFRAGDFSSCRYYRGISDRKQFYGYCPKQ